MKLGNGNQNPKSKVKTTISKIRNTFFEVGVYMKWKQVVTFGNT
jgi:hypothetical protein